MTVSEQPIYVFRTSARAAWCAKRFGTVVEHEVDKFYAVSRYNGCVMNFFFDELEALESASNPKNLDVAEMIEVTNSEQLKTIHEYSHQSEAEMRAEIRFESRF